MRRIDHCLAQVDYSAMFFLAAKLFIADFFLAVVVIHILLRFDWIKMI
ncbi:hypothetical protein ACJJI4_10135 [Microbulbifer sp. TRSA002]